MPHPKTLSVYSAYWFILFLSLFSPCTLKKKLFVLASRQKFLFLRKENPAVDTRIICPPPLELFYNPLCKKSYGRKIPASNYRYGRKIPASNYRYGRKIPAFWSLEGDFLYPPCRKSYGLFVQAFAFASLEIFLCNRRQYPTPPPLSRRSKLGKFWKKSSK
jgi:hypothetical protein